MLMNFSRPMPLRSQVNMVPGTRLPDCEMKLSGPRRGCRVRKPVAWKEHWLEMSPMQLGPTRVMRCLAATSTISRSSARALGPDLGEAGRQHHHGPHAALPALLEHAFDLLRRPRP